MPKHRGRTALYRLYDATDQLLYVGVSHNPDVRWGQHSLNKEWWPQVAKRTVDWHETRLLAEAAEATAISSEKPRHNIVGTPDAAAKPAGGKTPTRPIRVALNEWDDFGKAVALMGTDRSAAIRAFMAWCTHKPGAKLPKRPPRELWSGLTSNQPDA